MSEKFLAFSYKPKAGSSRTRVALWRALKDLGAVYLQQGVALLPSAQRYRARLEELKAQVAHGGGSASVASLVFLAEEDEDAVLADFRRARREEYEELAVNCEAFERELDRSEEKGDYSFPEVEEGGAELAKLERWLEKIVARDHYGEARRAAAEAALRKARKHLASYERAACARDKN
jgi:hypothetical protein